VRLGEFDRVRHGAAPQTTITPAAPPTVLSDDDLIAEFAKDQRRRGLAESTIAKRTRVLRQIGRAGFGLLDVTRDQLIDLIDSKSMAPAARNCWTSDINQFFLWANTAGHTDRHPASTLAKAKIGRRLPKPITPDDLAKALDKATPTMTAWLTLGAFAGLRCGEIAGLKAEDFVDGALRIIGKGNAERRIPLNPLIPAALEPLPLPESGPLWLNPRGTPWTPGRMSREISEYFDSLGMPWTAHCLRHHFATTLVRNEVHLSVVQLLMGHSSPETTSRYVAVADTKLADAISTMGAPDCGG